MRNVYDASWREVEVGVAISANERNIQFIPKMITSLGRCMCLEINDIII